MGIDLTTPGGRLRYAREQAGYKTARAFYEKIGVKQPTYSGHESGTRAFDFQAAASYADQLGNCTAAWLMGGGRGAQDSVFIDPWPRPLPARQNFTGTHAVLEPLHRRHVADLWEAAQNAGESFAYMPYGPFESRAALEGFIAANTSVADPVFWAVRPLTLGRAMGWLSLMNIEPKNAAIELGHIWFGPELQRTRAATEAMFLLLRHAAEDLGYRRLVWKCNNNNEASKRAALRLGFTPEGLLRAHMVVKSQRRDTAMFSIIEDEWPSRRDAILSWLSPENFGTSGTAIRSLASFRG
jgi:RimJ/RimL family protein N-acetyltransferase